MTLDAKNDLTLVGTQVTAERDITLKAANDLNILSAQNAHSSSNDRRSWGAEGGIMLGQDGFGIYGSANIGIGDLNREGVEQQEAYLYAGNKLTFESKRDTTIAGATLRGDEVTGVVGRNLAVSSVPNTGKVSGQEFDLSVTGSFGGASGSVGYGKTTGKTNWVENQTVISGKSKVDIRTEDHTQLDGSVITADNGNLKLDTGTLGFRNITGKDNEHSYYLNVSGSYSSNGNAQTDKPNKGMEGDEKNSWAVEGYKYDKDREQTLNATVGAGQITVRNDKVTGQDSTAGLNRDVKKAYEITKDEEHRTDLYVSSSSIDAIRHPFDTLDKWEKNATHFTENMRKQAEASVNFLNNLNQAINAQLVDINDVSPTLRKNLGDEQALAITKNFVRQGLSPDQIDALPENVLTELADFAKEAADYESGVKSCKEDNTCPNIAVSEMPADPNVINLPATEIEGQLATRGQVALDKVVGLIRLTKNFSSEKVEATAITIQAVMGPMKFLLAMTANGLLNAAYGDKIDELKEAAAIALAAQIVKGDEEVLKKDNDYAKEQRRQGNPNYEFEGDNYVVATRFLIDAVLGEFKALGIKSGGRILQIVDKKGPLDGTPRREMSKETLDALEKKFGADLAKQAGGLSPETTALVLSNLSRVDHSARHLIDAGIITANAGSKAARESFREIAENVLTNPTKTFDHVMSQGGQAVKGYYGKIDGKDVVIYVAKEPKGKIKVGDLVTAIQPTPQQMVNFGL
nr:hemagglutinin repeat-containing protein [Pseudomonas sp. B11(2017)]